ncbi:hypothetical protein GF356_08980 [candidate division GN15 bacterium]|nr:hypothetical protein [candidate division GN15 bacterium]
MRRFPILALLFISLTCTLVSAEVISDYRLGKERDESKASAQDGVSSNTAVDVGSYAGGVMLATGSGINYSNDRGETWEIWNELDGMPSSNISALYSGGARIWAGNNRSELVRGVLTTLSEGVSFSSDGGTSWTQVDFSETGQDIQYVWGGDRIVYDISGHTDLSDDEDWVFFTAFAGGLLGSRDGGANWQRIYRQPSDSFQFQGNAQPSLGNRFFSCKTDTTHNDTLFLWVGTAGGFFQYVFAAPKDKLFNKYIPNIELCNSCAGDTSWIWFGGNFGVSRRRLEGGPFISRFGEHGLRGPFTSAIHETQGRLLVGSLDERGGISQGLAYSDDSGATFVPLTLFDQYFAGSGAEIADFSDISNRTYMAAGGAGLWVTENKGDDWSRVWADSSDTSLTTPFNRVRSVYANNDTLRLGTDTGMVSLFLDPSGVIDSFRYSPFADSDTSGAQIVQIREQFFVDTASGDVDSSALWTVHWPYTRSGTHMVGRSSDGGVTWQYLRIDVVNYDVNFLGDTAFVCGDLGIRFTTTGGDPTVFYRVEEYVDDRKVDELLQDTILTVEVRGDTILWGTHNGYALSTDGGATYDIVRPNVNLYAPDVAVRYAADFVDVTGEWIIAIGVEDPRGADVENNLSRVWISMRPTTFGEPGVARGIWEPVTDSLGDTTRYALTWQKLYDDFAWNIAFNGDTAYLATSDGLLMADAGSPDEDDIEWEQIEFLDENNQRLVLADAEVYGVGAVGTDLWVGNEDRNLRIDLTSADLAAKDAFYVEDTETPDDEVYAFPVPYSHQYNLGVDFHFTLTEPTTVTIEVYDFAMNLVRRVVDNEQFPAGIYPQSGSLRPVWDGRNGHGDEVAVGVYYFKVELGTGDIRWGKLAVMP